jgi:hypothetical protein
MIVSGTFIWECKGPTMKRAKELNGQGWVNLDRLWLRARER